MSTSGQRSVLITGCSQNGLGYALAVAFHHAGLRVFATARDPARMAGLEDLGIECLRLDVCDEESIRACVAQVSLLTRRSGEGEGEGILDCLVNNAGGVPSAIALVLRPTSTKLRLLRKREHKMPYGRRVRLTRCFKSTKGYNMPISDISVPEAKELFELNVWSYISVTQAFLPLLLHAARSSSSSSPNHRNSPSLIVNNTSVSSVEPTPHNSVYHASKAAAAMFSTHMRIELEPFNVRVVDLKTGCVHSKFHANHQGGKANLPSTSIYMPVKDETESAMRNAFPHREDPEKWARDVVRDVVSNWDRPPREIWRGTGAWRTWFSNTFFPVGWWDASWRKAVGLDRLEGRL
ncbi:hypothetical protein LTR92_003358 [Exophiala xenobiotica]|uniref:NAD(P)-binding protein n=1 Tax=Vermiconidia calcicola TaxID=1690605 RepID=A0AAV9PWY5_9PEZI|nr:hypothetical protein LTR92_003358 [Exophiala xenobiotica]KAK5529974.1 hypothetical protein LTR25_009217 [Vermiconidia calcicola]KAK5547293.1 hypothetical protein LTR23_002512 [Chaetothyriales sp. CCFEE 6169]